MAVIPPHARKHLWERHEDETPDRPKSPAPGGEYPRTLHKGGDTRTVHDDDAKKAALKAGWHLAPDDEKVASALPQDDEQKKGKKRHEHE